MVFTHKTIKSHFDNIFNFVTVCAKEAIFETVERRKRRLVELWHQWECNDIELEVTQPGTYSQECFNYSDKYLDVMSELDALANTDHFLTSKLVDCKANLIDAKLPDTFIPRGHFLIGKPLTAHPEPYSLNNVNKLGMQMVSMRDQSTCLLGLKHI